MSHMARRRMELPGAREKLTAPARVGPFILTDPASYEIISGTPGSQWLPSGCSWDPLFTAVSSPRISLPGLVRLRDHLRARCRTFVHA